MKTRIKFTLLLVSTLIIGMVIGFLISGRITSTRVERMRNHYTEIGFNREFMKIINPSSDQREFLPSANPNTRRSE